MNLDVAPESPVPLLEGAPTQRQLTARLPRVVTESPAAVLMVEIGSGKVVHANGLARQLAPAVSFPVDIDAWSDAAGLRDTSGAPMSDTDRPLSHHADRLPSPGRTVTAQRASEETAAREALFVLGLPLDGAPGLEDHTLVALLPMRDHEAFESATSEAMTHELMRDRALMATACSFTVADAQLPDQPLVWVNPAFSQVTGYTSEEAIGRNCRFLQGPQTDEAEIAKLRQGIAAGQDVTVVLLNYRKDGTAFWNQVSVTPVLNPDNEITHFVGVQTDVTERVDVERSVHAAYEAEKLARAEAVRAMRTAEDLRDRISLVNEATGMLASTLDVDEALERLCQLVVPQLADVVLLTLVDEDHRRTSATGRHRDGHAELLARWFALQDDAISPHSMTNRAMVSREALLVPHLDPASHLPTAVSAEHLDDALEIFSVLGIGSALVVPLVARRRVVGVMSLLSGRSGRVFTQQDLDTAWDLGRRAALALDNSRLYAAEHDTALTLQRSMLPVLPTIPGLEVAAAYLPSNDRAEVGGDWWDVFLLPTGVTAVAIGDVMGHDITAAAAMGQLRSVLRTCAWLGQGPSDVLETMDNLVQQFDMAQLATTLFARLEPGEGDPTLVWANAGHLPPVLLRPDGRAELLSGEVGSPIGVPAGEPRLEVRRELPRGSTLLLYTDGLVETRERDIDLDLEALLVRVCGHDPSSGPQALVDALTRDAADLNDDVALLAIKIL